ncbi:MAG: hypothetical protein Q9218_006956 [Villophora microphyllina]
MANPNSNQSPDLTPTSSPQDGQRTADGNHVNATPDNHSPITADIHDLVEHVENLTRQVNEIAAANQALQERVDTLANRIDWLGRPSDQGFTMMGDLLSQILEVEHSGTIPASASAQAPGSIVQSPATTTGTTDSPSGHHPAVLNVLPNDFVGQTPLASNATLRNDVAMHSGSGVIPSGGSPVHAASLNAPPSGSAAPEPVMPESQTTITPGRA